MCPRPYISKVVDPGPGVASELELPVTPDPIHLMVERLEKRFIYKIDLVSCVRLFRHQREEERYGSIRHDTVSCPPRESPASIMYSA